MSFQSNWPIQAWKNPAFIKSNFCVGKPPLPNNWRLNLYHKLEHVIYVSRIWNIMFIPLWSSSSFSANIDLLSGNLHLVNLVKLLPTDWMTRFKFMWTGGNFSWPPVETSFETHWVSYPMGTGLFPSRSLKLTIYFTIILKKICVVSPPFSRTSSWNGA